ncbi:16S rRNA (cytosine(1402)-N(4))-methyltransferase RsmH [uncultured Desulfuromonas sp.]|uniref:16S rRNA (cytosine(1402)-N(4))-methyltransferase RsmH n=1 Tax=uncultured Desulfuromonas sp. TaxID=181013 RepID=UPI002612BAEE|nr:16S rRNA (cytosine(1402)-N(4))-methyltransferase RsmH [uncultured Desulfuromonas sp.]
MPAEIFAHLSVMPEEVVEYLRPRPGGVYLDGTVGGGGHAGLLLEASAPDGRLIGLDRDPAALRKAAEVLAPFADRALLRHANFSEADEVLAELGIDGLDGMLLDLGVSSHQLDTPERGFSFREDAPLDMRMDPGAGETAADVVNEADGRELARIFFEYGEERWARRIARRIVDERERRPLATTAELAELVRAAVPGGMIPSRVHPATRVFQALRIHVNRELEHVARGVAGGIDLLKPGGRLAVISFHSLEDRIVKRIFRQEAKACICPPRLPLCACGKVPRVELVTRKAVRPSPAEVDANPRARSAILRVAERCS